MRQSDWANPLTRTRLRLEGFHFERRPALVNDRLLRAIARRRGAAGCSFLRRDALKIVAQVLAEQGQEAVGHLSGR